MLTKRIIPCLDVRNGMVVKGINFDNIREIRSPVELAKYYSDNCADELVFYDITASNEDRRIFLDVLSETAKNVFIPLTVGGGINTIDDIDKVLKSGADKVSINTGAINNPDLIKISSGIYGSQCIVLSVDIKLIDNKYTVFSKGGRVNTGLEAISWIKKCVSYGAGEVVVNSIDTDGMKNGFDLPLLRQVCSSVDVPVIASGGAGSIDDFITLFSEIPNVDAGLAASVFHFGEIKIIDLKKRMSDENIPVRLI